MPIVEDRPVTDTLQSKVEDIDVVKEEPKRYCLKCIFKDIEWYIIEYSSLNYKTQNFTFFFFIKCVNSKNGLKN